MNEHGGNSPKNLEDKDTKPSGSPNWKALKRATEDVALSPNVETVEDSSLDKGELDSNCILQASESETAQAKTNFSMVNWAAMKSLAREFSVANKMDSDEPISDEPFVELETIEIPAPSIESGALQRAAAILRGSAEVESSEVEKAKMEPIEAEKAEIVDDFQDQDLRSTLLHLSEELKALRNDFKDLTQSHCRLVEQGMLQDQVFNVLHAELQDYKTDFAHERFRPTVQNLLFLDDSLEQFDREMKLAAVLESEDNPGTVPPDMVRTNISFFRGQLIEALATCAVTPMETPQGLFDAYRQKAVKLISVPAELDNTVQEVMRGGWYFKGQLLRSAEVVVGKAD